MTVVKLFEESLLLDGEPDAEIVAMLENLLTAAKAGKVRALAYAGVNIQNLQSPAFHVSTAGEYRNHLHSAAHILTARMDQALITSDGG